MKFFLLILLTVFSLSAIADEKPIEIVVPFGPGGAASNYAQVISEIFNDHGWPTIVVNKPGADAVLGGNYAAKAKPDGRTLFLGTTSSLSANPVVMPPGIEYNKNSFAPIVPIAQLSMVLAVPATSPINNYQQFKFYVRTNPEKFNIGVFNANLAGIFNAWAQKEGLPHPTTIPYKGSNQVVTDLAGGNLPFAFDTFSAPLLPLVKAGKIKIIATLDSASLVEAGNLNTREKVINISSIHPDLEFGVWYGLFAPAGTPQSTINEMNRLINRVMQTPKYREKMQSMDIKYIGGTPESLKALQNRDLQTLSRFPKESK